MLLDYTENYSNRKVANRRIFLSVDHQLRRMGRPQWNFERAWLDENPEEVRSHYQQLQFSPSTCGLNFSWLLNGPSQFTGTRLWPRMSWFSWSTIRLAVGRRVFQYPSLPCGFNTTVLLYFTVVKCSNGCRTIIPDAYWSRTWRTELLNSVAHFLSSTHCTEVCLCFKMSTQKWQKSSQEIVLATKL